MEHFNRLALSSSRLMRVYVDNAVRQGNAYLSTIRNSCNLAAQGNNSELLCSNANTRQRISEVANRKTPSPSLSPQMRQLSTQTSQSNIFNIQDEKDFSERVLQNGKPVIVDFYAVWCGPCKILGPKLEKVLAGYEGKADFAKVNIDNHTDLAFDYNVSSVPTVIAFKDGKAVSQFVGLIDDDKIAKFVKDIVEK